jgi:hypothetical protein
METRLSRGHAARANIQAAKTRFIGGMNDSVAPRAVGRRARVTAARNMARLWRARHRGLRRRRAASAAFRVAQRIGRCGAADISASAAATLRRGGLFARLLPSHWQRRLATSTQFGLRRGALLKKRRRRINIAE